MQPASGAKSKVKFRLTSWRWVAFTTNMGSFNQAVPTTSRRRSRFPFGLQHFGVSSEVQSQLAVSTLAGASGLGPRWWPKTLVTPSDHQPYQFPGGCPPVASPRSWSTMPRYERPEMLLYNVGSLQAIYPLVNWHGNGILECGRFKDAFPIENGNFSLPCLFPGVYLKSSSWSCVFPNLGLVCDPKEQKAGDSWFQFLI